MARSIAAADHDTARVPAFARPNTWAEQDRLFPRLLAHVARMALFAVNTDLRDANLCSLQWSWDVFVSEIGRSAFGMPEDECNAKRPHIVILNDAAWSIIQAKRGRHAVWVFPYRGRRVAVRSVPSPLVQVSTFSPCFSTTANSLSAIPLGRFVPASHF